MRSTGRHPTSFIVRSPRALRHLCNRPHVITTRSVPYPLLDRCKSGQYRGIIVADGAKTFGQVVDRPVATEGNHTSYPVVGFGADDPPGVSVRMIGTNPLVKIGS